MWDQLPAVYCVLYSCARSGCPNYLGVLLEIGFRHGALHDLAAADTEKESEIKGWAIVTEINMSRGMVAEVNHEKGGKI